MNLLEFFHQHVFLAFLALCFINGLVIRILRMPSLLRNGYPPSDSTHCCDADGDWHRKDDKHDRE